MRASIPILMYHQVTPNVHPDFVPYSVTPRTFKIHMQILELFRFTPINLTQLENYRNGKSLLPKNPVMITFDDCYQECIDHAVPILEEKGFTAVFYMPTDYAGRSSHWIVPELGVEFPIINWETVKRLDSSGFQIGSHSMSHPYLTNLSSKECFNELRGSRNVLEDRLGHEIVHLAYPYGYLDERVKSIAAESGYQTACSTIEQIAKMHDDPLALPRINIHGYYSNGDFMSVLHMDSKFWQHVINKSRMLKRLIFK